MTKKTLNVIMYAKGRAKHTEKQMPSSLEHLFSRVLGERSDQKCEAFLVGLCVHDMYDVVQTVGKG